MEPAIICRKDYKEYKSKSLEDNVYFTLKEIFTNCDKYELCMRANSYSSRLSNGVDFEYHSDNFEYTPLLQQEKYLESLCHFFNKLNPSFFQVNTKRDAEQESEEEHCKEFDIPFEEWWRDFEHLKTLLSEQLESLKQKSDESLENPH